MRSKILRIFIFITYPLIIVGIVAVSVLFLLENKKFNDLNHTFEEARTTLNEESADKQITIDDLQAEFQELTATVNSLTAENETLKQQLKQNEDTGEGRITGKIYPFITAANNSFVQYQQVCAVSVANKNILVCKTVSTIDQQYSLSVPVGTYKAYAELYPTPAEGTPYAGKKAYYTQYIKCAQQESLDKCDVKKDKAVEVEVKAGETVNNVDPIAWQ